VVSTGQWLKVQNGNLVAIFRLHYGEKPLIAFRKLEKKLMTKVDKINVPIATWRKEDMAPFASQVELITDHMKHKDGYSLLEVAEAFGWLNQMLRDTGGSFEREHCQEDTMRHLEYHGVAIVRMKK